MTNPLPGYPVTTAYGVPGSWSAGYHTGEDRSTHGKIGVAVLATKAGEVSRSAWDDDYGNYVAIRSGGVEHWYCHLSERSVSVGRNVAEGERIGKSGNTGNSTGPHLHYEERVSPFGYMDHRKPQFPYEEEEVAISEEDADRIAARVWAYAFENADDANWPAKNFLYWIHANVNKILDRL